MKRLQIDHINQSFHKFFIYFVSSYFTQYCANIHLLSLSENTILSRILQSKSIQTQFDFVLFNIVEGLVQVDNRFWG